MPTERALKLAEKLTANLPVAGAGLFHPWREQCPFDAEGSGPDGRLARLASHLDCEPRLILVGEACGYQGCRYSGIPFTSERLLLEGAIPRMPAVRTRLSQRAKPFSEPSATIVWKSLFRLGLAGDTILWNALPLHPHRVETPWSNRTPTDAELAVGAEALNLLSQAFVDAKFVAVGRKAEASLQRLGLQCDGAVRHPANGGAKAFFQGLSQLVGAAERG
jgi:hypothetical protein